MLHFFTFCCLQCLEFFAIFMVLAPYDKEAKELIEKTLKEGEGGSGAAAAVCCCSYCLLLQQPSAAAAAFCCCSTRSWDARGARLEAKFI